MAATMSHMARKKKAPEVTTAVVRVESDLARMAGIIATATGRDVSAVISPMLRNLLEREFAKVIATLGEEIGKTSPKD